MSSSLRVLVVDDQPRARQSLMAVVATWLHSDQVSEAQTGAEAIVRAESWRPDIILMDARMPAMDGVAATRQIKAHFPGTLIIVLSLYPEYRDEALAAGADLFLGKTDPPEKLLAALSAMAEKSAAGRNQE